MDGNRIFDLSSHQKLLEPKLRFGSVAPKDTDIHPLRGLIKYGPYSKSWLARVPETVRIAFVGQAGMVKRLKALVEDFERKHQPVDQKDYRPEFKGLHDVFGVRAVPAGAPSEIILPDNLNAEVNAAEKPHRLLADAFTRALSQLNANRYDFDMVMVGMDAEWEAGFYETEEDFNLHDYLKAVSASMGMSLQIIRSDKALSYHCRAGVMWRLAIALYTKAGGVPWVLEDIQPDTAFIGIDYALRRHADDGPRFATCCAQVFDAEGSGLEFLAYEAAGVRVYGDNPYLSRDQMLKIMARSLAIYQKKHDGDPPNRVVVHKNTPFREEEIDGCLGAFTSVPSVELIQVQADTGWRGYRIAAKKKIPNSVPGYPVNRGTILPIGDYEALLWTKGDLPEVANGRNFFKEGKGIPEPILITRHAGRGDLVDACKDTLALTKMNWNNDGPYDGMPVTLNFAGRLAQIVKRMPDLKPHPYPVRLFM